MRWDQPLLDWSLYPFHSACCLSSSCFGGSHIIMGGLTYQAFLFLLHIIRPSIQRRLLIFWTTVSCHCPLLSGCLLETNNTLLRSEVPTWDGILLTLSVLREENKYLNRFFHLFVIILSLQIPSTIGLLHLNRFPLISSGSGGVFEILISVHRTLNDLIVDTKESIIIHHIQRVDVSVCIPLRGSHNELAGFV